MVELTRTETVGADGMIHLEVPDAKSGESVRVTIGADGLPERVHRIPDAQGRYRTIGGLEGKLRISEDFDDPLPEMESYS